MASLITMPRLSPTMEEGTLAKWTKKEGDKISPGDIIAEVETDKANMEFPLEDEGVLLRLLVKEGDTVKLGDPVAVLGEAGEDPAQAIAEAGAAAPAATQPKAAAPEKAPPAATQQKTAAPEKAAPAATQQKAAPAAAPAATQQSNGEAARIKASPLARRIASERGVDIQALAGSGPGGRVVKRDVLEAAERPQLQVVPAAPAIAPAAADQLTPASQMRKTIARRLVEAKREIPHIYLTAEATVDRLLALREQLNELAADSGVKVSVNDLVVKAMALGLRRLPEANVSWTADGILRHGSVNVGIAVSLPDGLITPVLRDADAKSLGTLAQEARSLAERARAKKLQPHEYSGGSATVSNLGMYGIRDFVAIINPPESVILAVGTTEKRPIVVEKDGRDEIVVARRMLLTLSCDHRVVDGVLGARLLAEVVKLLEKPMGMLL